MVDSVIFFKTKTISLSSKFIVIFLFLVLSIIGFYINPLAFNVYKKAQVDMPSYIYNLVKYSGLELLAWWCLISSLIVLKDVFLKKSFIVCLNILFLVVLLISFYLFIDGLEAYHWPIWGF